MNGIKIQLHKIQDWIIALWIDPAQLKSREHKERICIREFELDVDKWEEKVFPPPPIPFLPKDINSTILLHFQRQRSNASAFGRAPREASIRTSFRSLPHSCPQPPAPWQPSRLSSQLRPRRGPTLTEEEEADEEQIELEGSHSSAPRSKAGRATWGGSYFLLLGGSRCSASAAVLSGSRRPSVCPPVPPGGLGLSVPPGISSQPRQVACL